MGPYGMPGASTLGEGGGSGSPEWLLPALMGTLVGTGTFAGSGKNGTGAGSGAGNAMMLPILISMMRKQPPVGSQSQPYDPRQYSTQPPAYPTAPAFPDYSAPVVAASKPPALMAPQKKFSQWDQIRESVNSRAGGWHPDDPNFGQY